MYAYFEQVERVTFEGSFEMKDTNQMTQLFKALGDENRLKIVQLLSCGTLCACKILESFEFSQPALSQHMKVLMAAGLVVGERQGNWMYYSLNKETMEELKVFVTEIPCTEECKLIEEKEE